MPLGTIGDLLGLNQAKDQRKASAAQNALLTQQREMMQQAQPYYQALMQWMSGNAGLQMPQAPQAPMPAAPMAQAVAPAVKGKAKAGFGPAPAAPRMPTVAPQMAAPPMTMAPPPMTTAQPAFPMARQPAAGLQNSALGVYGSNPADVFRMQQAEEDIDRLARQRAQQLQYRLGQQGIGGSGTMAAALARNESDALSQLANFRRQLAIGAGQEQERRMSALMQFLNPALGAGPALAQQYGQMAGQFGQQGAQQQQQLMQMLPFFF